MIQTDRLKIYPASREQMENFIALQSDDVFKSAYTQMLSCCLAHPEEWDWYAIWMIELKNGTHVGELCFKGVGENGAVEIGYGISESHRGRGYATEAVCAITDRALSQPHIKCVTAETEENNIASQKVLSAAGFVPTGKKGEEGPLFVKAL